MQWWRGKSGFGGGGELPPAPAGWFAPACDVAQVDDVPGGGAWWQLWGWVMSGVGDHGAVAEFEAVKVVVDGRQAVGDGDDIPRIAVQNVAHLFA